MEPVYIFLGFRGVYDIQKVWVSDLALPFPNACTGVPQTRDSMAKYPCK